MISTQLAPPACEPGPAARATRQEAAYAKLAVLAMGFFVLATWMLEHPYAGLVHDSIVYTLMALARLHPESLSHDIFLRFGSQDQYTIFGPVFSAAIRLLDLERAAAWLTLLSQGALFVGAWLFVRQFVAGTTALLATGLLIALPSVYGSANFFHYTENFLTPRLPAEALVLAAVAAALTQRYVWAALSIVTALLVHPIMGVAGVAMLAFTFVAIPRPRLMLGGTVLLLAACVAACLLGVAPFVSFSPADSTWLHIVSSTSPFLFVANWSVDDWSRVAVMVVVLSVGRLTATAKPLRDICAGALLTGLSGLVLTALYCDALRVILVIELQPWRWLWLTQVVAILLAPLILRDCLRAGSTARAAMLLLPCAWLFHDDLAKVLCAALAIACAAGRGTAVAKNNERVIFLGSVALLFMASALTLADRYLSALSRGGAAEPLAERVLAWLRLFDTDGLLPGGLLVLMWWGLERATNLTRNLALAMAGALACAALALPAWDAWTAGFYTPNMRAAFSAWRKEIPLQAEVLWPVNPVGVWYLLERTSYWSPYQAVGAVFSKTKALELNRRTIVVGSPVAATPAESDRGGEPAKTSLSGAVIPPVSAIIRDIRSLRVVCRSADLAYVVSWNHIGPSPVEPVTVDPGKAGKQMYLYRCSDFRKSP